MAFGLHFGGSDSAKRGDGGSGSGKSGGSDSARKGDGRSDSVKKEEGGSDSGKRGDEGLDPAKRGNDEISYSSGGSGDEGSGSRKHAIEDRSTAKQEEAKRTESSISSNSASSGEGSGSSIVSEARKIQVKEAELEQAKLSAKDVHRRQEQVYGNFWSVSPLLWATLTGNMYALAKFRLLNAIESEVREEDVNFLELLSVGSEEGMNCLHVAANRGQCLELTHLLQHREILCKSMTSMKEKIVHTARLKSLQSWQREVDFEDVLAFLVSIPGIDLNSVDKKGNTALLLASSCGHLKAVELLLEASAAMDVQNEEGLNCLHVAASAGHTSVVERIVQEAGLMDIKYLNVKSRAENEWTALHYAVVNSCIHTLEKLLNYPDIAVDCQDNEGCTPLILACSLGYVSAVRILLRKGADKLIKNNKALNSSLVAAWSGHVEVLKELTEHSHKAPEVPVPVVAAPISEHRGDYRAVHIASNSVLETSHSFTKFTGPGNARGSPRALPSANRVLISNTLSEFL